MPHSCLNRITTTTETKRSFHVEHPYMETLHQCPLCGQSRLSTLSEPIDHTVSHKSFTIQACDECGFGFTNPRPNPEEIGTYYRSDDYISHTNAGQSLSDRIYQVVRKRTVRSKHKLISQYIQQGAVLDYGCGTGNFLGYLRSKGYRTVGIEPSSIARAQAVALLGPTVVPTLRELEPDDRFQVITLWHVLEHVHDVRDTLRKLHSHAAPGTLLVIAVPDRESWDATHYGAQWAAYDVPRHLSHFRRKDIRRFLDETGFTVFDTRPMWFDAPYVSMLSEKHRGAGSLVALVKGGILGCVSNLVAATTSRPTSSSLFLARKA